MPLHDSYGRHIQYLRVSITDRCNLRCVYCLPLTGVRFLPRQSVLRYEEIRQVVRAGIGLGITKIRITGGEPLVREGVTDLVQMLAELPGIEDLAMTTNGVLLARHAQALKRAGLQRINISLDTLHPERFQQIARFGTIEEVLEGIAAARTVGFSPLKINTVVTRGVNDDDIVELGRMAYEHDMHVRFIELMPIGGYFSPEKLVPAAEIMARLETVGLLEPVDGPTGSGPARAFRWCGGRGTVGLISPVTQMFCAQCNRLRLTASGRLRPCLDDEMSMDLLPALRPQQDPVQLERMIKEVVAVKPKEHCMTDREQGTLRTCMAGVGG